MKTFEQLTPEQQQKAKNFAYDALHKSFSEGILDADILKKRKMYDLANEAAEGGTYDDEGNPAMEQIDVPFFFQGGCI